eukprot:3824387-Rhodomonas_salina.2
MHRVIVTTWSLAVGGGGLGAHRAAAILKPGVQGTLAGGDGRREHWSWLDLRTEERKVSLCEKLKLKMNSRMPAA